MQRSVIAAFAMIGGSCMLSGCDRGATAIAGAEPEKQTTSVQAVQGGTLDEATSPGDTTWLSQYKLAANDRVRIAVVGQEKLSGEFVVDRNGVLVFPLIGQIRAGGVTVKQLEEAIAAKLEPDYLLNPQVNADVLMRPFFVVGEVKNPGSYPYDSEVNVQSAVAKAGGFKSRARQYRLYIRRIGSDGKMVRLAVSYETLVRPGDILQIDQRYF